MTLFYLVHQCCVRSEFVMTYWAFLCSLFRAYLLVITFLTLSVDVWPPSQASCCYSFLSSNIGRVSFSVVDPQRFIYLINTSFYLISPCNHIVIVNCISLQSVQIPFPFGIPQMRRLLQQRLHIAASNTSNLPSRGDHLNVPTHICDPLTIFYILVIITPKKLTGSLIVCRFQRPTHLSELYYSSFSEALPMPLTYYFIRRTYPLLDTHIAMTSSTCISWYLPSIVSNLNSLNI